MNQEYHEVLILVLKIVGHEGVGVGSACVGIGVLSWWFGRILH